MQAARAFSRWTVGLILAALLPSLAAAIAAPTPEETAAAADVFELAPGALVDPDEPVVYLMRPDGGVEALDLDQGSVMWHSEQADKPLTVFGGLLVAQKDSRTEQLPMMLLDRHTGESRLAVPIDLPADVTAAIGDAPAGGFEAMARVQDGELLVGWRQDEIDLRGMYDAGDERPEPRPGEVDRAYRIDLGSERAVAVSAERMASALPLAVAPMDIDFPLPVPAAIEGDGPVLVDMPSSDGRHRLISQRVARGEPNEYRWTIVDRANLEIVGQVRAATSFARFFVRDRHLIYEEDAVGELSGGELVMGPRQLRCVRLGPDGSAGELVWQRPLRDTAYRGPLPH